VSWNVYETGAVPTILSGLPPRAPDTAPVNSPQWAELVPNNMVLVPGGWVGNLDDSLDGLPPMEGRRGLSPPSSLNHGRPMPGVPGRVLTASSCERLRRERNRNARGQVPPSYGPPNGFPESARPKRLKKADITRHRLVIHWGVNKVWDVHKHPLARLSGRLACTKTSSSPSTRMRNFVAQTAGLGSEACAQVRRRASYRDNRRRCGSLQGKATSLSYDLIERETEKPASQAHSSGFRRDSCKGSVTTTISVRPQYPPRSIFLM
jgi:hypothetical protein